MGQQETAMNAKNRIMIERWRSACPLERPACSLFPGSSSRSWQCS